MSLIDAIRRPDLPEDVQRTRDGILAPPYVSSRLKRGRDRMKEGASYRSEAISFFHGSQFVRVNSERMLLNEATVTNQDGTGKPLHRMRRVFNLITPIIGHKVSTSISRVPGYQVNPSTRDQQDVDAAKLSRKIAYYGYDKWDVRDATKKVITFALVSDEGFAMPYFDTSVGPYYEDGTGEGEVKIRIYSANEVYWEPGVDFNDSKWHAVEQARPLDELKKDPNLLPGISLSANAKAMEGESNASERKASNTKLTLVVDYYERPCAEYPQGRWFTLSNDQVIYPPQDYPCEDHQGNVLDEPILHRLSFITDPHSDRDMGLVRFLIDPQRTFNQSNNKQLEWMQLCLNPQSVSINGKLMQRRTDEPGAHYEYWGSGDFKWMEPPTIPPELEGIKQAAREIMQFIAADQDIPTGVEAARGIQALIERDEGVWSSFYGDLAEFHSRLMRHCLYLVQRYYDEERLINLKGDFGPESLSGFTGAQLRGQADITVLPESVTPRTRQEIEARIRYYAEMGWITPEVAMAAINTGVGEALIDSYERDMGRAYRIIRALKEDWQGLLQTAQPDSPMPSKWMPREHDNIRVHIAIFGDWMKTEEFESQPDPVQTMAMLYYRQLRQLEMQQAQEEAMQRYMQAQNFGMTNASRPGQQGQPTRSGPETGMDSGAQ